MLLMLGEAQLGEKASTKTMLVLQMDIAAMTLSINPIAMYSDAICSGVRAMVAWLGLLGCSTGSLLAPKNIASG